MRLLTVGLSHRTAPVDLRERVDFARGGLEAALRLLAARSVAREFVILSTCNRAEIYAVGDGRPTAELLGRFLSEYHGVAHADVAGHLYVHEGDAAARHLFRVASGLDSLVVGEPQISGQVKTAYAAAADRGYTGALINRAFHCAFATAKRVRRETGLAEGAVSVSYAAIALARKILGDLQALDVLIVGAGEMAKLTGIHLQARHVRQITVVNRTFDAAESLAQTLGGRAVPWSALGQALRAADIVVSVTGSAEPILTKAQLKGAMRPRRGRPLFIMDIAVPRDVEPDAADIEQLFLFNIDDLHAIVQENMARRGHQVESAERIVSEEVTRFSEWTQSREVVPTVVALRRRFESIRQAEITRLGPRLAGLPPEAHARLDEGTRLIVEKLLLTPTEQLKSVSDEALLAAYADALNALFRLATEESGDQTLPVRPQAAS
ncbi:MAG: glutamyl-tRNA reductase [Acidobacteria bacterium]|nr:glutamyl-tRNA reductase [Acidobacteriota bacterium]